MRIIVAFIIFLLVPLTIFAQILIETPTGERRIRYERCDEHHNCRMVEQTISYFICDEHHNCQAVDASQSGKAKMWDEEELTRSGVVFSVPSWL